MNLLFLVVAPNDESLERPNTCLVGRSPLRKRGAYRQIRPPPYNARIYVSLRVFVVALQPHGAAAMRGTAEHRALFLCDSQAPKSKENKQTFVCNARGLRVSQLRI